MPKFRPLKFNSALFLRRFENCIIIKEQQRNVDFCPLIDLNRHLWNMVRVFSILLLLFIAAPEVSHAQQLALPNAEGFGRFSKGGRGGQIIKITNLNDSGPGSLRNCIDQKFPRICIFEVSGIIELESSLVIDNNESNITIAGQSAPFPGITLRSSPSNAKAMLYVDADHVVVQYIRVRPGPSEETSNIHDGIEIIGGSNGIYDHVSVSWANDETFSSWFDARNVTLQNSIISEGLFCSTHEEGCHSKGILIAGDESANFSVVKNLMAHHRQRLPMVKTSSGSSQIVNNISYNPEWGATFSQDDFGPIKIDYINNYFKQGPNTTAGGGFIKVDDSNGNKFQIYAHGNALYDKSGNNIYHDTYRADVRAYFVSEPHNLDGLNILDDDDVYDYVLENAGADMQLSLDGTPIRAQDTVDQRVVNEVRNGSGQLIDGIGNRCWKSAKTINHLRNGIGYPKRHEQHCLNVTDYRDAGLNVSFADFDSAGWPKMANNRRPSGYDSDNDGLYDKWERRFFGSLAATTHGDPDNDGYSNIEELLNVTDPGNASQVIPAPTQISVTPTPLPATPTVLATIVPSPTPAPTQTGSAPIDSNAIEAEVVYQFLEGSGNTVHDQSGNEPALDLIIEDPDKVTWNEDSLRINSPTILRSVQNATRLIQTCRTTEQVTLELWIQPLNAQQYGPARILTLSESPMSSNFTVGHGLSGGTETAVYDVRLRSSETDNIGRLSLFTTRGSTPTELTHLVYTRGARGKMTLYVNGEEDGSQQRSDSLNTWNEDYKLALANEFGGSRPWLGEYHKVAIYCEELTAPDVKNNYSRGPNDNVSPVTTPVPGTSTPIPATPTPTPLPTSSLGIRTVSGELYVDGNGNGAKDLDEQPLAEVIVLLIDFGTENQVLTLSASTDENGFYIFTNVPQGDYIVSFALPPEYRSVSGSEQLSISNTADDVELPAFSVIEQVGKMYLPIVGR